MKPVDLRLAMGAQVARDILGSDFATTGPLAMQMHAAVAEPAARSHRGFAAMLEVEAPPECWETLANWVTRVGNAPVGLSNEERRIRDRLWSLAYKVQSELDRLAMHPAYHDVAVKGISSEHLPGWRVEGPGLGHAARPTPFRASAACGHHSGTMAQGVLVPEMRQVRGAIFTDWHWEPVSP